MSEQLREALQKIANLDASVDSVDGYNEWFEANCFQQAQGIAREALAVKDEPQPEAGWQPIETAPKDGTEVLLVNDDGIRTVGRWSKHNHVPLYGWIRQVELYGEEFDEFDPVAWVPIPPAPQAGDKP
jgi:hypothetical protein